MPIKINELQVNVHFENQETTNVSTNKDHTHDYKPSIESQQVVQKAVKEVLRILNERNER
ncbi:MAG: DUF5908 family protein [Crocinitomicaceae bacterium]|nr:DUF5908 family protein [Crocinitomicaceae bacterium]